MKVQKLISTINSRKFSIDIKDNTGKKFLVVVKKQTFHMSTPFSGVDTITGYFSGNKIKKILKTIEKETRTK